MVPAWLMVGPVAGAVCSGAVAPVHYYPKGSTDDFYLPAVCTVGVDQR